VENIWLHIVTWPRDIKLNLNSVSSNWMDLAEAIASGAILAMDEAGEEDKQEAMRMILNNENSRTAVGAALRWAVGSTANGGLELQLQSLPLPEAFISSKPLLKVLFLKYPIKKVRQFLCFIVKFNS